MNEPEIDLSWIDTIFDLAILADELGYLDGNSQETLDSSFRKLNKEVAIYNDRKEIS